MDRSRLPQRFIETMEVLFAADGRSVEFGDFLASFEKEPVRGIRFNAAKAGPEENRVRILREMGCAPEDGSSPVKIPWSDDGYYLPAGASPGKHPYYHAGIFYIQEPSAMLPAMLLGARPGENILDLCAAPGGKTVKIACDMKQTGLLVSNDINGDRVKALLRNAELQGCSNCVITNEPPEALARSFPVFFDRILVDAPCSGEGMFRRDDNAVKSWMKYGSEACTALQRDILDRADAMLRPGGTLVYSTCTFSACENEGMILEFLETHPHYRLPDLFAEGGPLGGLSGQNAPARGIGKLAAAGTCRIFPHRADGDGHFGAVLVKEGGPTAEAAAEAAAEVSGLASEPASDFTAAEAQQAFERFAGETLSEACAARVRSDLKMHRRLYGNHLYTFNKPLRIPDGIRTVKKGYYLGDLRQTRGGAIFEPSHAFLMSLTSEDLTSKAMYHADDPAVGRYLRGETLFADPDGPAVILPGRWTAVCAGGYPLGWVKAEAGGMFKNFYPKGWRRLQ